MSTSMLSAMSACFTRAASGFSIIRWMVGFVARRGDSVLPRGGRGAGLPDIDGHFNSAPRPGKPL
mgnify:CR=1 FL=1